MSIQSVLQPLLFGQCLEARLHDFVQTLESIFEGAPVAYPAVRTSLVATLRELNAAIDQLKMLNHMLTIAVTRQVALHYEHHGCMPPADDPVLDSDTES